MAKVPFTKLNLSKNNDIKILEWNNQKIEVKQYLSVKEKLDLIADVINLAADDHVFCNPCKIEIFELIEIILKYTNINITEKQQEDILKLYDLFISSNFAQAVKELIPKEEIIYLNSGIQETVKEIYRYRDSFMGVIEAAQTDYKDLNFEVDELENKISNPDNLTLLKDVVTKLG